MRALSTILTGLLFLSLNLITAQSAEELHPCGYSGKDPWLVAYQNGEIATPRSMEDSVRVDIQVHIVGNDGGGGYISLSKMLNAFDVLQRDFEPLGVYFCLSEEVNFINNSSYNNHDFSTGFQMMNLYNVPNVVNNYIVDSPAGNCGYYTGGAQAIALAENCLDGGDRTWSHEVGHYFTLPHTFLGWNSDDDLPIDEPAPQFVGGRRVERADSSNCAIASDGFCDTPADYLAFRWSCTSGGIYGDSLLDPDSTRFAVQGWPIMSYANDNCVGDFGSGFSGEQEDAMLINLNTSRSNLIVDEPFGEVAADADAITQISPLGGNYESFEQLEMRITWTPAPETDFYILQLNRTQFFGATVAREYIVTDTTVLLTEEDGIELNRRFYWRVRPVNRCKVISGYSGIESFRVTDIISSTIDPALNAALSVFPNPLTANNNQLRIVANQLPTNEAVSIELLNVHGQAHVRPAMLQPAGGQLDYNFVELDLPAGVYFLRIRQADRLVVRKLLVSN